MNILDREILTALYNDGLSLKEIAFYLQPEFQVSWKTIGLRLQSFGVPMRGRGGLNNYRGFNRHMKNGIPNIVVDRELSAKFSVRIENGKVLLEPNPINGVKGFTMILSSNAAKKLGHELISAAVRAASPTTHV